LFSFSCAQIPQVRDCAVFPFRYTHRPLFLSSPIPSLHTAYMRRNEDGRHPFDLPPSFFSPFCGDRADVGPRSGFADFRVIQWVTLFFLFFFSIVPNTFFLHWAFAALELEARVRAGCLGVAGFSPSFFFPLLR